MRLGHIQKSILAVLRRGPVTGVFIGSTTRANELQGLDLAQVERALDGLLRRGIVRREGCRIVLNKPPADELVTFVHCKVCGKLIDAIMSAKYIDHLKFDESSGAPWGIQDDGSLKVNVVRTGPYCATCQDKELKKP